MASNIGPIGQLFQSQKPLYAAQHAASGSLKAQEHQGRFQQLLDERTLKFSAHAQARMKQRGIMLQKDQMEKIISAVDQAEAKGARDSLVLFRDLAMIVNVPSRTVVTAMQGSSLQQNVFTQIDSAVVIS